MYLFFLVRFVCVYIDMCERVREQCVCVCTSWKQTALGWETNVVGFGLVKVVS